MAEHPIGSLMRAATDNIKAMVDVNAIIGDPVQTPDGSVILPISRVAFGFASGGSDFRIQDGHKTFTPKPHQEHPTCIDGGRDEGRPFGGGSGGGMYITPIAFLVVSKQGIQVVSLDNRTHLLEKVIDATPGVLDHISSMFHRGEHESQVREGNEY